MPWYCNKCGAVNDEEHQYCGNCGRDRSDQAGDSYDIPPASLDGGEKAALFFGNLCLSPLLGIILYFVWKEDKPHKAEEVCKLTVYAVGAWIVLSLLFAAGS